jgi:hypothetical protein
MGKITHCSTQDAEKKRTGRMGRLIVDGNMVYEIDEECLKKRKPPRECGVQREIEKIRREEKPPKQHT